MHHWPETNESLILRVKDPADAAAWSDFLAIYRPVVVRMACGRWLQHADADDLAQQVYRSDVGHVLADRVAKLVLILKSTPIYRVALVKSLRLGFVGLASGLSRLGLPSLDIPRFLERNDFYEHTCRKPRN